MRTVAPRSASINLAGGQRLADCAKRRSFRIRPRDAHGNFPLEHVREPPEQSRYFYLDVNSKGRRLNGAGHYTVTCRKLSPVNGFWSLTVYNEHHLFEPNPHNRYLLGTKNKGLSYNADGSLTLYVQNESAGPDKESNWDTGAQGRLLAVSADLLAQGRSARGEMDAAYGGEVQLTVPRRQYVERT